MGRFETSPDNLTHVVESIVDFGSPWLLNMNDDYLEELVDEPSEELTTKELQDLHLEMQYTQTKK